MTEHWCHYDDSRVSTNVVPTDVVSNAAYVLNYKHRDVDLSTPELEVPLPSIIQDHQDQNLHEGIIADLITAFTTAIALVIRLCQRAQKCPRNFNSSANKLLNMVPYIN